MDLIFLKQIILSFIVGAGFVLLVTVIAERFGSKIGGLVSGLPGSTLVALLFIGIHQGAAAGSVAASVSPAVLGVVIIFFTVYASIGRLPFWSRLGLSVSVWFVLSYLVGVSGWRELSQTVPVLVCSLFCCYFFLERVVHIPSAPPISISYKTSQLAFRAVCAGLAVVAALVVSKVSGPIWGGVASTFPVATVASLVVLQKTAGIEFTRAMLKSAVVSAAMNVGSYVILVSVTYPSFGVGWGTVVSICGSIIVAYGSLLVVNRYVK